MSINHDAFYYLQNLLGGYFHQDCFEFGQTVDDIVDDYIDTNWPYDRLGLRADIQRLLHLHPDDTFDAMDRLFSMNAYPQLDNESMARWLRELVLKLKATDSDD
ncbi:MAG: hypothetical protein JNL19_07225 [Burkholderiales bacterium]|nr:hypothetical protein [Burkholderiales bacterium]